ncbi:MAG: hypothetical protein U5L09_02905 [Bacteroidales bacterium]|nr:hypothetical protein [Bacteroidales bacterium]
MNCWHRKITFFQRSNPSFQTDPLALTDEDVEKSFASAIKDKQVLQDYIKALNPCCNNFGKAVYAMAT